MPVKTIELNGERGGIENQKEENNEIVRGDSRRRGGENRGEEADI